MKKKILSLSMALLVTLSFSACGPDGSGPNSAPIDFTEVDSTNGSMDSEVNGEAESEADGETKAESDGEAHELSLGHNDLENHTYENEFFGIGLKLDDSWIQSSDEELWYENDLSVEITDLVEILDSYEAGIPLNCLYARTNLSDAYIADISKRDEETRNMTVDEFLEWLPGPLFEIMEIPESEQNYEKTSITIDGVDFPSLNVKLESNDRTFNMLTIPIMRGDYMFTLTLSTPNGVDFNTMAERFYLIK